MHQRYVREHSCSATSPRPATSGTEPLTASEAADRPGLVANFGRLPVDEREILLLAAVEQMSYAEIGTVLGVPAGTVVARLKRARERMRTAGSASAERDSPT
jgi:RNA polymerase sigma factor (sigma-70 family)